MIWLGGLVCFLAVALIAGIEAYGAFEACPGTLRRTWYHLVGWSAGFGAWGLIVYLVLLAAKYPGGVKFNGTSPPDLALAFTAIALAQTARSEVRPATRISGSPRPPGDVESYYAKFIRWLRATMYCTAIDKMDQVQLRPLLRRGLHAAYDLAAIGEEFRGWIGDIQDTSHREAMQEWSKTTFESAQLTEAQKAEALCNQLIQEDLTAARLLAKRRATAIVDLRAL